MAASPRSFSRLLLLFLRWLVAKCVGATAASWRRLCTLRALPSPKGAVNGDATMARSRAALRP